MTTTNIFSRQEQSTFLARTFRSGQWERFDARWNGRMIQVVGGRLDGLEINPEDVECRQGEFGVWCRA